jgi:hypothetical protein
MFRCRPAKVQDQNHGSNRQTGQIGGASGIEQKQPTGDEREPLDGRRRPADPSA